MAQPKKGNGWTELSMAFEATEKTIPKNEETKETSTYPCFSTKADSAITKKSGDITSLSKLMEACEPKSASDLSVSKQKQHEIADWFADKYRPGKPRILLISGPSGCGKTAALKIIAADCGYKVVEWTTPTDSVAYESYASTRQSDKFLDFLVRTTRYNSVFDVNSPRLLLVKDIPNVYLLKDDLFSTLLENYFNYGREPLVFIFTDGGDSKMLKTLFPSEVRARYDVDHIGVNSTTQTAMKNMLKRVSSILNSRASHSVDVKQRNIEEALSNSVGDVRSTILNLIFNSLKVADDRSKHDCETRQESLGLLHAVGRVINPKRAKCGDNWKFVHDPDDISSNFVSQSTTYLHFLHENYVNTMSTIEDIEKCSDILGLSDVISREWQDANLTELNMSLCTRAIMVHNKNPVSGWNPVRKPRSENTKISRNLGAAEENFFRKIIRPETNCQISNPDHISIDQNSD